MSEAKRDLNYVTTLMGVDFSDLETPVLLSVDALTNRLRTTSTVTGTVTTEVTAQALKTTVSGAITYLANAPAGTLQSAAAWRVMKIDETSGSIITFADGDTAYDNVATDLTALSYS